MTRYRIICPDSLDADGEPFVTEVTAPHREAVEDALRTMPCTYPHLIEEAE